MKIQKVLGLAALFAWGPSVPAAQPNLIVEAHGRMRVQLAVPSDSDVDLTTQMAKGRIEIAPVLHVHGLLGRFTLNRLSLSFADFDIARFPFGNHAFRSLGVDLSRAVDIVAAESAPDVYTFTLLPDDVTFHGAALVNGELHEGDDHPTGNVTGTIDVAHHKFSAHAVIMKHDTFLGIDVGGPLTIDINGRIAPASDTDGDGVDDQADVCPLVPNVVHLPGSGQPVQQQVPSPLLTAPPNVVVTNCFAPVPAPVAAVDVCDGLWTTVTSDAPASFGVGTTTVTWTASTIAGRVNTGAQTVTIADWTPPRFTYVPPAKSFLECVPRSIGLARATDDCDGSNIAVTNNAPAVFHVGRTIVTWTARDAAGNSVSANQTVTVTRCPMGP